MNICVTDAVIHLRIFLKWMIVKNQKKNHVPNVD